MNEAEARGYELVYTDAGGDTAKQISDVEDIVAQKVDYLILDPLELEGSVPALEAAKRAGVPTIIIDRMVNGTVGEDFITYIGTDFVWEGKAAGEWLVEKTGGNAKIVEITGTAGSAAAIDRQNGFMEAIAGSPDMEVIVSQTANFSRSEAVKVMENIIQAKAGEFNVVFAHNDQEALGVIQALKSAGLVPGEDVIVVGIDGEKDAVKSIIAGELSATVTCNPLYGPIVFDTLEQIMTGNTVPENIILADYIIDGSNAEEKLADAF
jgi:ribose transport system substrate-binding protein